MGKYSDDFENWFSNYPKQIDKATAYIAFKEALKSGVTVQEMTTAVINQKLSGMISSDTYTQKASNWLDGRRWEDKISEASTSETNTKHLSEGLKRAVELIESEKNERVMEALKSYCAIISAFPDNYYHTKDVIYSFGEALSDIDKEDLTKACEQIKRSDAKPPTIARIRGVARDISEKRRALIPRLEGTVENTRTEEEEKIAIDEIQKINKNIDKVSKIVQGVTDKLGSGFKK